MTGFCPLITCRLTDQCGNEVDPYGLGNVTYTVLPSPENRKKNAYGFPPVSVAVEGYVAVYSDKMRISPPIPFCILQSLHVSLPREGFLTFRLRDFHCWALPRWSGSPPAPGQIELLISIETSAFSKTAVNLLVPQVDSGLQVVGRVCIYTNMLNDSVRFHSGCRIRYQSAALRAEVSHYYTIADGGKRTYRNSDGMKKYGDRGLLSPQEVSYYNVFVNGVLQPRTNYILEKDELTFTTQDIPAKGRPIVVLFTTWKDFEGRIMDVTNRQYNAVSDGTKKQYTDSDEIKEYGNCGIPSPNDVSYFNLYINGVLQPKRNYIVKKGILRLTTSDAPVKGAPVILESIVIRDSAGQLYRTEIYAYNAYSNGGKIYTDQDEIKMYGTDGIPDPRGSSYQNLFINGVLQPPVDYRVREGYLVLDTVNDPAVGAPIILQSVNGVPAESCCRVQMSDAALAQWKKVYTRIQGPCAPAPSVQDAVSPDRSSPPASGDGAE